MERIIHQTRDKKHPVVISEEGSLRTLRFGVDARQSCMDMEEPHRLILPYTQRMMTALLFPAKPEHFLILGLGGGSIARFLLHHHPTSRIDTVERSQAVIKAAYDLFNLPRQDNLRIIHADAGEFTQQTTIHEFSAYDVIFVDIFEPSTMTSHLYSPDFYASLLQRLGSEGVMAINLWAGNKVLLNLAQQAAEQGCGNHLLMLPPVSGCINTILFIFPNTDHHSRLARLRGKALAYEQRYALPFKGYLKKLRQRPRSFLSFLIGRA